MKDLCKQLIIIINICHCVIDLLIILIIWALLYLKTEFFVLIFLSKVKILKTNNY